MKQIINLEKLKELHAQGLSDREIGNLLNCHHNSISNGRKKLGLDRNWANGKIEIISDNLARCSRCREIRSLGEFQHGRKNSKFEYRFSYCNKCRKIQCYAALNRSPEIFFKDKQQKLQLRAKKLNIEFSIPKNYLYNLFVDQDELCFYTDIKMEWGVGKGISPQSASVDKICPQNGYIESNIVLCCTRINSIKFNTSLEEMKLWMPDWHYRLQTKGLI